MSQDALALMHQATRGSTKKKYKSIEKKWLQHCTTENISRITTTTTFSNFLASEFGRNLSYGYIKGYTAALADYIKEVDFQAINQLKKGMHNVRPPKAKYCVIWDVNNVLTFLSAMRTDTPMFLSQKVATLLMILSGNRVNMLSHMKITHMVISEEECVFQFEDPLKHTREGFKTDIMRYRAYPDKTLCPVHAIATYLGHRNSLCGDPNLFITTVSPYRKAHHDTIARWIKEVLCASGIDTRTYQAHSCRAASTSIAALAGVSLSTIIKSASWCNVSTFKRFYHKEIADYYDVEEQNFGQALLNQYADSMG